MIEFSFGMEFSLSVGYWYWVHLISHFDDDVMFACKLSFQSSLFPYTFSSTPTTGSISVNVDAIFWMVQVEQTLESSMTAHSSHIQNQVSSILRVSLPLALSHSFLSLSLPPPKYTSTLLIISTTPILIRVTVQFCLDYWNSLTELSVSSLIHL